MKRGALYVRVSTQEQKRHGLSVDAQIDALKRYCTDNNIAVVKIYNDAGISGRKSYKKRRALLELVKDCNDGLIDQILFTKLDRWFRSVGDYYEVMGALPDHVTWRAIWEDYETETSSGRLKVNIMLSVAQDEADRASDRVRSIVDHKKAMGQFVGSACTGYKVQKGDLVKDPSTQDAVQAYFDVLKQTMSVTKAMDEMRLHGLIRSRETCVRMLKNATYSGDAHGYKCEPYISESDRLMLMEKCTRRVRTAKTTRRRTYLFSGLIKCPLCGGNFSGRPSKRMHHGEWYDFQYYQCSAGRNHLCDNHTSKAETVIERYLIEHFGKEWDSYRLTAEFEFNDDNSKQIDALERKLRRIGDRYEDGDISREEYKSKRDDIKAEIAHLKASQEYREMPKIPDNWRGIYAELNRENRKAFWNYVLDHLEIIDDKIDIFI